MKPLRAPVLPAFVLHARPFREHHWLLELLTPTEGRFTAVGRDPKPETFRQLKIRHSGRSELKRLDDWRYTEPAQLKDGQALLLGLHFNELIVRLLPRHQSDEPFFGTYASTLLSLTDTARSAAALRFFERRLLESCGFGIDYRQAMDSGEWIQPGQCYRFDPALGFCSLGRDRDINGASILAMAENDWQATDALKWGGRVHRARIEHLLEGRRLVSRDWVF